MATTRVQHDFIEKDGSTKWASGRELPSSTNPTAAAAVDWPTETRERSHSDPGGGATHLLSRGGLARHQNLDGRFEGSFGALGRPEHVHAKPWFRRREYFADGWTDRSIMRAATIELTGTCLSIFLSGQFGMTLMNNGLPVTIYVFFWNSVFLATFIFATAPGSGGHINPAITFTVMLAGLCPVPREEKASLRADDDVRGVAVYYIIAQSVGGALAGGILRGVWGTERAISHKGGGNFFDPSVISPGSVLLLESVATATILYLAVGLGIDPRQQTLFGPYLGPALVGIAFGMWSSATTNIAPGFTGANGNPARALALAIAGDNWSYQWIWWVGPLLGSIMLASLYNLVPPHHVAKDSEKKPSNSVA